MTKPVDLTALVGSRICHDLISPLGAIGNGLELMELSGAEKSPEFTLIEESVRSANARIKFFRIAFGAAAPDHRMSETEIVATLRIMSQSGRINYIWDVAGEQAKQDVRIAFLLFQCFETAMPFGGSITVTQPDGRFQVRAEAERLKVDTRLWETLRSTAGALEISPSQVQFALLPALLDEANRALDMQITEQDLTATY